MNSVCVYFNAEPRASQDSLVLGGQEKEERMSVRVWRGGCGPWETRARPPREVCGWVGPGPATHPP